MATLEQLIERMDGFERRLQALESVGTVAVPVAPPPVITPPREIRYQPVQFERVSKQEQEETEYFLGAQVLPRVGAGVLVLGIGYLVSLAISKGLLGPWSVFGLAVALCVTLIGIGQWKRDEREQYGELLTGAGVSGLYITFAAGHAVQHLYPGETLVALFLATSLASLAYSFGRQSRAFLGIGIFGGFAAALLPLRSDAYALTTALHATILLAAVAVAARHRWAESVLASAVVGCATASVLAFGKAAGVPYGVGLVHLSSLALLVGWNRIRTEDERQVPGAIPALAVFGFFCLGYAAMDKLVGSQILLLSGAVHIAAASLLLKAPNRAYFVSTAVAAILLIAPIGLPTEPSVLAYPVATLTLAILARRFGPYALVLGVTTLAAGVVRYIAMHFFATAPAWLEPTYLSIAAASALALGFAARDRDAEAAGWLAALAAATRLGYMALIGSAGMTETVVWTTLLISLSLVLIAIGFLRDLVPLRFASFFALAATVAKVVLVDLAETSPVVRVLILMTLGLVLMGGGYLYIWRRRSRERANSV